MSDIRKRLEDLTREIEDNTQSILTGTAVEIDNMDARVAQVCADIEKLEREEAVSYSEDLQKMIEALDHLVTAIKNNPEIFDEK